MAGNKNTKYRVTSLDGQRWYIHFVCFVYIQVCWFYFVETFVETFTKVVYTLLLKI